MISPPLRNRPRGFVRSLRIRPGGLGLATDELPPQLSAPLALAAKLGARLLAGEAVAAVAALPLDWRARAAQLEAPSADLIRELSVQTSSARLGIKICFADAERLLARAHTPFERARAFTEPFARLVVHLFARHAAPVAAVHAKLSAKAHAFAGALAHAHAGDGDPRDARGAFDFVLAIPASEPALRRACLLPIVAAMAPNAPLGAIVGLVAGASPTHVGRAALPKAVRRMNDLALRAAFAALAMGLPPASPDETPDEPPTSAAERADALARAEVALARQQAAKGSWHGDYGGPLFLLPMYIGTAYMAGAELDAATRDGMIAYLTTHQNPDGGWGLDVEGDSHVFTTVLNYVAMRLLGLPSTDPRLANARAWFLARGGAVASASWGKLFLAILGLYEWAGVAPVPPELWLVPESLPLHPHRMWCHARMVYLPMSYLYGARVVLGTGPLIDEIRSELYTEPYDRIDWAAAQGRVADEDFYHSHDPLLLAIHKVYAIYDRAPNKRLREKSLAMLLDHIAFEDRATNYICIGPVNKLFDLLVWVHARPGGEEVQAHLKVMPEYLWHAPDGVKMQGYNSSELWDTAFAVQALVASGGHQREALAHAAEYIERTQIIEEPPEAERYYRHPSLGAWPFSTRAHGWPITDCTSEGLKATIALDALGMAGAITPERRADAVARILSWQNPDGGWASYERQRAPAWLERFNPSEVFGEIMIDRSYTECTSACVTALHAYLPDADPVLRATIGKAIERATEFLLDSQRPDGSWEGAWGVCFTYGTWFAVTALALVDGSRARKAIERACEFLLAHQQLDGGWGETVESCRERRYIHAETGQAVMTSWAVLTFVAAGRASSPAVQRGLDFLVRRQQADGTWPEEHIAGVFNHTCAIHYHAYKAIFPLWALAAAR